jgi:F-type H+-transporting ATPase subunit epsilon
LVDEEVAQVNVSTEEGQLGILPNHANLMAQLAPGELIIKKGEKELLKKLKKEQNRL